MTITTALGCALIKCCECPATHPGDDEQAQFFDNWSRCPESDLWTCPICIAEQDASVAHLREAVRLHRRLHKEGEHEAARSLAFAHGVIDRSES